MSALHSTCSLDFFMEGIYARDLRLYKPNMLGLYSRAALFCENTISAIFLIFGESHKREWSMPAVNFEEFCSNKV